MKMSYSNGINNNLEQNILNNNCNQQFRNKNKQNPENDNKSSAAGDCSGCTARSRALHRAIWCSEAPAVLWQAPASSGLSCGVPP